MILKIYSIFIYVFFGWTLYSNGARGQSWDVVSLGRLGSPVQLSIAVRTPQRRRSRNKFANGLAPPLSSPAIQACLLADWKTSERAALTHSDLSGWGGEKFWHVYSLRGGWRAWNLRGYQIIMAFDRRSRPFCNCRICSRRVYGRVRC